MLLLCRIVLFQGTLFSFFSFLSLFLMSQSQLDYSHDPSHESYDLIVRNDAPFNAEPTPPDLVKHYITPEKYFFCRNHGPIPLLDENEHTVEVRGIGCKEVKRLSLKEIKDYEKVSVMMVMEVIEGNILNNIDIFIYSYIYI